MQKNICDKLALGYGSKYQLLRMLGWHRNELNEAIAESAKVDSEINWLDFTFNGPEDKEILNFEFIPGINKEWTTYWACGKGGINWDAVGISKDGTIILVEAKAHLGELKGAGADWKDPDTIANNTKVITTVQKEYEINGSVSNWTGAGYQLANRIIALDFLLKKGYKAKLVYLLFENGYEFNTEDYKSLSHDEWIDEMNKLFKLTRIKGTKLEEKVNICIFNCNKK